MQLIDLKLKVSTAEQEREFYFTKLRDIEVMCQMPEVKQERVGAPKTLPLSHTCSFVILYYGSIPGTETGRL